MERYDYYKAVKADVEDWIEENKEHIDAMMDDYMYQEYIELWEYISSECECDDGITGNASGSYHCNAWEAEESLCHNWDLLMDTITEMGYDMDFIKKGPESCDVLIRYYLVPGIVQEVLEEMGEYDNGENRI